MIPRILLLLGASHAALAVTSPVPERFPESRYTKLRAESPFAVATATEKPAEEKVSWAQNLYLGSVATMTQDGMEKEWIIIKDRTQPGVLIQLFGNDPNVEGYQLVKLEWSDEAKKTKASIKKGGEFATIEVDQAAFANVAPPMPSARPGGQPGVVPVPPGGPGRIATPIARPPVNIPRPTNLPPAIKLPQPQQQPQGAPNTNTRQRIRVIPNNP
ncbi:MAG: hypothetical protein ABMA13_22710 [Chthoniobacteraceae bacterium]